MSSDPGDPKTTNIISFPNEVTPDLTILKSGGGGGNSGGMDTRIAVLEAKMDAATDQLRRSDIKADRLDDKLTSVERTLARIEGKLDAKVDWKWALGIAAAILMVMLRHEILALVEATP